MFLILIVVGLVGLLVMAVPAFGGHGHAAFGGDATHLGHVHGLAHDASVAPLHGGHGHEVVPADTMRSGPVRFVPSPRSVFSVLALYGAFGNAFLSAAHLKLATSAVLAVVPALAIDWLLVEPLWRRLVRYHAEPSGPLAELILAEAVAVTPFHNGRGIVSVEREGRRVQMAAHLRPEEAALPVGVGERLRVEDVDTRHERFVVSVLAAQPRPETKEEP